jgi:hypothetical protein
MHPIRRFCFHPEGKDRLIWAWIDAAFTLAFLFLLVATYNKIGHWTWVCSMDAFFFAFNFVMCWAQGTLYDEWKKKQPPA